MGNREILFVPWIYGYFLTDADRQANLRKLASVGIVHRVNGIFVGDIRFTS